MRDVRFCIESEMLPKKELNERSNTLSWRENEEGRSPVKLLC